MKLTYIIFWYRQKVEPPRVPPMVLKKIGPNGRLVSVPHQNVPASIAAAAVAASKSPLISVRQNLMSSTIDLTDEEETAKPRAVRNSLGNQPPALVALQGQQMKGKTLITAQPKSSAQQQAAANRNAPQKFCRFFFKLYIMHFFVFFVCLISFYCLLTSPLSFIISFILSFAHSTNCSQSRCCTKYSPATVTTCWPNHCTTTSGTITISK